jgi:hypothetical protein
MSIAATVRDNLIKLATAYAKATDKSMGQISKEFYGNGSFFDDLAAGDRSIGVDKLEKMVEQFRQNWPDGARWPLTRAIFMNRESR